MKTQTAEDTQKRPPINAQTAAAYGREGGRVNSPAQLEAKAKGLAASQAKATAYRESKYAQVRADLDAGKTIKAAAKAAGVTPRTVYNWLRRYA